MGMFLLKHNIKPCNPNDFLCKICLSFSDDPHYLFLHCPFTQKLISDLEPLLTAVLKKPTTLTQSTLLFNYINTIGAPHIITSKLTSLIRLSMFNLRNYNTFLNSPIPTSLLIEEKYKIKTKFKTLLEKISQITQTKLFMLIFCSYFVSSSSKYSI